MLDDYDYNGSINRNAEVEVEVEADWSETLESTSLRRILISFEHYR